MDSYLHENSSEQEWLSSANNLFKLYPHLEERDKLNKGSPGKIRRLRGFVNILDELKIHMNKNNYRISKAQKRLVKGSEGLELDDNYSATSEVGKSRSNQIAKKYFKLTEERIECLI